MPYCIAVNTAHYCLKIDTLLHYESYTMLQQGAHAVIGVFGLSVMAGVSLWWAKIPASQLKIIR